MVAGGVSLRVTSRPATTVVVAGLVVVFAVALASAGLAISRPARRTQVASAATSWPFDVTLVPSPR